MTPTSHRCEIAGLEYSYLTWGEQDSPPLLLVHGGLDHAAAWAPIAEALAIERRVIAVDLRGHGDSAHVPGGDYSLSAYIADLAVFIDRVCGGRVDIVSHSMGARISLLLAGARPHCVSRLVAMEGMEGGRLAALVGPAADARMEAWLARRELGRNTSEVERIAAWLDERDALFDVRPRVYPSVDQVVERLLRDGDKRLTREQAMYLAQTGTRVRPDGGLEWKFDPLVRQQIFIQPSKTLREYYRRITCPVLHIYGAQSWAYPPVADDLAAFSNVAVNVIENAGHWVHLNRAEAVVARILDFMKTKQAAEAAMGEVT
ncbi:hypothetical protein MB02_10275 [Croceicoccus estronivorus]|uniref:alpha/beta fold hydrolase n=1 Tax=Croceicoccus estronivorus TaxID=1172626 RepID=UPI0008306A32|nr:alpha/beta hydrolase [Croceicoccus estronivorus]OCC23557.1 hypothetical protein MB02_10275 [Croceicoccus estronivorus]